MTYAEAYPSNLSAADFMTWTKARFQTIHCDLKDAFTKIPLQRKTSVFQIFSKSSYFTYADSGTLYQNITLLSSSKIVFAFPADTVAAKRPVHNQQVHGAQPFQHVR